MTTVESTPTWVEVWGGKIQPGDQFALCPQVWYPVTDWLEGRDAAAYRGCIRRKLVTTPAPRQAVPLIEVRFDGLKLLIADWVQRTKRWWKGHSRNEKA